MMNRTPQVDDFEGLVRATARRYADLLADEDIEDIRQILRVKVWKALARYDARRSDLDVERYVFGCLANQVKDLLKAQMRLNAARSGSMRYIEDIEADGRELCVEDDALAAVEDQLPLPSTLTRVERAVVVLLVAGHNQTEAAVVLGISRTTVRRARAAVQRKMADWDPGDGDGAEVRTAVAA